MDPSLVWFLTGVGLLVLELIFPTLLTFFFGFGAWIVALTLYFMPLSMFNQLLLFLISSNICIWFLRSKMQTRLGLGVNSLDDEQGYIGEFVVVLEAIHPPLKGKVELNGTAWDASSDIPIEKGHTVQIVGQKSITFQVSPVPNTSLEQSTKTNQN
jgi:membrane protein implicated in regulation of membrane protease activity